MKKSLGQHFLTNPLYHQRLVDAAHIAPGDTVIEIGPGTGLLTDHLLTTGAHVIAIEKDRDLIKPLQEKYRGKNITIVEADVLRYTPENTNYILVGNLPYYLTSHLLRTVLLTWPPPKMIVFMVQKEVAMRMTAQPPRMNMLAVLVQSCAEVHIVASVRRGNFSPPPKVDSAIVSLAPKQVPNTNMLDLAAQGFTNPRKKLKNNLPEKLLLRAGIDPSRRAQTISVEEWKKIATTSSLQS